MFKYVLLLQIFLLPLNSIGSSEKTVVFILGTGRCGTSCLTGILQIMGLNLGSDLKPTDEHNPKGYFEHEPIQRLNTDVILKELGIQEDCLNGNSLPLLDPHDPALQKYKSLIKNALTTYFNDIPFFGLKGAGYTVLLPLYIDIMQEQNYTIKIIVMRRNALEIAESYHRFDDRPKDLTLLMVKSHHALVEQYKLMYDILDIEFKDLVNDTENVVTALCNYLPTLNLNEGKLKQIEQFLDKNLVHHKIN